MVFFNFFCFLCVQYGRLSSSWFCCHADIIFVKIPYSHTVKDNVGGGGGEGEGKDLKGYCHGDLAVYCAKLLKYWIKNFFSNLRLFLENREENIKGFLAISLY